MTSITNGIGAGLIAYAVIKVSRGGGREVSLWLWPVVAVFAAYFAIEPIETLLGVS